MGAISNRRKVATPAAPVGALLPAVGAGTTHVDDPGDRPCIKMAQNYDSSLLGGKYNGFVFYISVHINLTA